MFNSRMRCAAANIYVIGSGDDWKVVGPAASIDMFRSRAAAVDAAREAVASLRGRGDHARLFAQGDNGALMLVDNGLGG